MSITNSFFANPNASRYVDTLFSPLNASSSPAGASRAQSSSDRVGGFGGFGGFEAGAAGQAESQTAGQRALSRIIEILTLGGGEESGQARMNEQLGYVTSGQGTEGEDRLTVSARGIFGLDTGAGNDVLTLSSATISGLAGGAGDDTIDAAGRFIASIDGGDGRDDLRIKAALALDILGGAGDDSLKVAAQTIRGLDGGEGNDRLVLQGNRIFATGGEGDDTVDIQATGRDAVVEYGFGRGGGQDAVTSNGPLSLALGSLAASDLLVTVSGNSLTASIQGSTDRISVTLAGKDPLSYRFAVKDGQTMLMIEQSAP
ncbi:RTX toxin [Rhizobium sp. SSA_523]|uniref:RTX toxin n=1 Tax=Rhizobium sp. SSA_523 TaxID=2952477 RepID=UPI0020908D69|nr:RTX toxin [Rhizobium sp. SSA_523]MCO5730774.1 RTX toxin [Rhizobium sp. SSA_523]WKC24403.1 RTX toxin [Rhizobium sp. SSA_523]